MAIFGTKKRKRKRRKPRHAVQQVHVAPKPKPKLKPKPKPVIKATPKPAPKPTPTSTTTSPSTTAPTTTPPTAPIQPDPPATTPAGTPTTTSPATPDPSTTPTSDPTAAPDPTPGTTTAVVPTARERLYLNRFGAGFTQSSLAQLRAAGTPDTWLAAQLDPSGVPEAAKVAVIDGWFASQKRSAADKWADQVNQVKGGWEYSHELGNWSILRRIYSRRTVLETMVDFWSTHLHIPVGHDLAWTWRYDYDATIRQHALGTFEDLLVACALHPAMRLYLDNWLSVKGSPNENQGRELLEVHTVGVGAGYTEAMVKSSAALLSGYTVDWGKTYNPTYDATKHTTGAVQVLGFSAANTSTNGQSLTVDYLKYLAHHPATAQNIARKLATYFVSDSPSSGLVDTLASVYTSSGTDIGAVLQALATSPEFLTSEGQKVRTPVADLVATARVLDVDVNTAPADDSYSQNANWTQGGAPLFSWPRPDGPPVTGESWSSASRLFASWSMHLNHAGGYWPRGAAYRTPASWLPQPSMRFDAFVNHLSLTWLGRPADARLQQAAQQATSVAAATVITSAHPIFQWLFPPLTMALLDTPDHMTT